MYSRFRSGTYASTIQHQVWEYEQVAIYPDKYPRRAAMYNFELHLNATFYKPSFNLTETISFPRFIHFRRLVFAFQSPVSRAWPTINISLLRRVCPIVLFHLSLQAPPLQVCFMADLLIGVDLLLRKVIRSGSS